MANQIILVDDDQTRRITFTNRIDGIESTENINDAKSYLSVNDMICNVFLVIHYGNKLSDKKAIGCKGVNAFGNPDSASFVQKLFDQYSSNLSVLAYTAGIDLKLDAIEEHYSTAKKFFDKNEKKFKFLGGIEFCHNIESLQKVCEDFIQTGEIDLSKVQSTEETWFDQQRVKFVHDFLKNILLTRVNKELTLSKMQRNEYCVTKGVNDLTSCFTKEQEEKNKGFLDKVEDKKIVNAVTEMKETLKKLQRLKYSLDIAQFELDLKKLKRCIEKIALLSSCVIEKTISESN